MSIALLGIVAASVGLRLEQLTTAFWVDEGISVGIASHPLRQLPTVLARDGSPPLYYALLHGWMAVVGRSDVQTHVLSLLFVLATIPIALWAGWSLFGRRVGWILALMTATSPFLTEQSGETRMYALVALLALVATASFLHGFAFDRRRYRPVFFVSLLLLLYTHNWGLFFALAAALRRQGSPPDGVGRHLGLRRGGPALPPLGPDPSRAGAPHRGSVVPAARAQGDGVGPRRGLG